MTRHQIIVIVSLIFSIAVLALSYACISASASDNDKYIYAPRTAITESIDSLFMSVFGDNVNDGTTPGGVVMVYDRDSLLYGRAFGTADLATGNRICDSTAFNLSSSSKIFSTVALLKLVEEGRLNLEDPLSKYFPDFQSHIFDSINVRHILSHSSGLPDLRPRNVAEWEKYTLSHETVFGTDPDYRLFGSEREHMGVFRNLEKTEFTPGSHYQRNDPGYILVATIIENVTGENFEAWMHDNIFAPAGMHDTFYFNPATSRANMAHGYRLTAGSPRAGAQMSVDGKWSEFDYGEAEFFLTRADRGVYSSARDMRRWSEALYQGRIISNASLDAMVKPLIQTNIPHVWFGLGMALNTTPERPLKSYHMNSNGGFNAVEATWPRAQLHYFILSNRNDWNIREVVAELDSILYAKNQIK